MKVFHENFNAFIKSFVTIFELEKSEFGFSNLKIFDTYFKYYCKDLTLKGKDLDDL